MQLSELFCCTLLTITVTIHFADSENQKHEISENRLEKKMQKRDTSLILDGYHIGKPVKQQPRVVYRRISKHRYNRNPHGASKPRVPHQKNTGYISHHPPPSKYRSRSKPKYRSTKPPRPKPTFAPIEEPRYHKYPRTNGFGEPPIEDDEYTNDNGHDYPQQPKYSELPGYIPKLNYPDQPVDSYGIPITTNDYQLYAQPQRYPWSPNQIDNEEAKYGEESESWQSYKRDSEPHHSYAKKHVSYAKPYDTTGDDIDFPLNSYSDVYKYGKNYEHSPFGGKKKAYSDKNMFINKPWVSTNVNNEKDQEVVGGQYAEPPARYVPRFQPSVPMFIGNDDFEPGFVDPDVAASKSTSPYVNYKNSNIAFSPQNLNDAFSL